MINKCTVSGSESDLVKKRINTKFLSPFLYYCISWVIVLIAYSFSWSRLLPPLKLNLLIFLVPSILVFLILFFFTKKIHFSFSINITLEFSNLRKISLICLFLYLIEAYYAGGFPLLTIINGNFDYGNVDFGLPLVHVFINAFASINCSYSWLLFTITKRKKCIYYTFFFLSFGLLTMSRSFILYNLVYILIINLSFLKLTFHNIFKTLLKLCIFCVIIVIAFAFLGDLRQNASGTDFISQLSYPTESFNKTKLPSFVLWTYCYITTPLANLQNTINFPVQEPLKSIQNLLSFFSHFSPETINKRFFLVNDVKVNLVVPYFNVSTIYAEIFSSLGYVGLLYSFIGSTYLIFFVNYIRRINNPYSYLSFVYLCTIMFFNMFTNMYNFVGLSIQFWVVVLFIFISTNKYRIMKLFFQNKNHE